MDAGGAFAPTATITAMSRAIWSDAWWIFGRRCDHLGLAANFYFFAVLNLAGAMHGLFHHPRY